ncbi:DUF2946 family protein [Bordetella petrii]|uniref:DUF2946 family protein n=1 Tax=Bordetella petrii TaxID=94624 RepID=UPI001E55A9D9|nr:DUF2946 family protein [Bordetella petrii]MCD0503466.1 DUF2946 family protein [Bordetella petrii]
MDPSVKQALAKWPDVPAVYGWLSLDERGRWLIHEQGDAAEGGPGDTITSPQIVAFIGRNYESDDAGRWYFQNGPQRVYVRLDAAPCILRRADAGTGLVTHTGRAVGSVAGWWLDDTGRLYARTDAGAGMVEDRELEPLLRQLRAEPAGVALVDALDQADFGQAGTVRLAHPAYAPAAPLQCGVRRGDIPGLLGFVANPRA